MRKPNEMVGEINDDTCIEICMQYYQNINSLNLNFATGKSDITFQVFNNDNKQKNRHGDKILAIKLDNTFHHVIFFRKKWIQIVHSINHLDFMNSRQKLNKNKLIDEIYDDTTWVRVEFCDPSEDTLIRVKGDLAIYPEMAISTILEYFSRYTVIIRAIYGIIASKLDADMPYDY